MIPLRDNIPSRTTPVVNYAMILACSVVFWIQVAGPPSIIDRWGMVPARLTHPGELPVVTRLVRVETPDGPVATQVEGRLPPAAVPEWLTPLTCIFLHGGWLHILGNLWFLYIFGDNVEDRLGHVGYGVFYLACGVGASAAHYLSAPESVAPTIGASGAIAGVMGAYMLLYPRALVMAVIPIFIILEMVVVPAPLFLGVWFAIQLLYGAMSADGAGVAWWAHIGGFAIGAVVTLLVKGGLHPPVDRRRQGAEHSGHYRIRF